VRKSSREPAAAHFRARLRMLRGETRE